MKTSIRRLASSCCLGILSLGLIARAQPPLPSTPQPPSIALAPTRLPDQTVQDKMLLLLKAIETDRYADFAAALTEDFKAALTREAFREMRESLAPELQKGYDLSYLGELKKRGYTTYVWKIVFRDHDDTNNAHEVLMTFTIEDVHGEQHEAGTVAGFYLE